MQRMNWWLIADIACVVVVACWAGQTALDYANGSCVATDDGSVCQALAGRQSETAALIRVGLIGGAVFVGLLLAEAAARLALWCWRAVRRAPGSGHTG